MKVNCIDKEIRAIFAEGYYRIPRFQRPYSWELENVEEFWNDIVVNGDADYFIGSMVVFKDNTVGSTYDVVDGQQRLTTITMILAALRNTYNDANLTNYAKGIHNLIERADINFNNLFVLQTETSYPYLQEYIQKFGKPELEAKIHDEEQMLNKAFNFITAKVNDSIKDVRQSKDLSDEDRQREIGRVLSSIRDKMLSLKLIFVEVDNEDDAYMIFETLNTRGKELGVSDLVKNHVTRLIKPSNSKVDATKEKWNNIRYNIEGSQSDIDLDTFLLHFWLSRYEYVTARDLFKSLKKLVTKEKDNAKEFLEDLLRDSKTYREINDTSSRNWSMDETEIRNSLDALALFRVKQPIPMVLSVMREYSSGNIRKKHAEGMLRAIENFHFVFTAVTSQRSSGGISQMYASSARQLLKSGTINDKIAVLDELKKKLATRRPNYFAFEASFFDISYLDTFTKQKKLVQYILRKIDKYYTVEKGVPVNYELMTIEHIAPQNAKNGITDPSLIGQLGNLILVNKELNGKLANKGFTEKKKLLSESHVWLDDEIKKATAWGENNINDRTIELAKLAHEKLWAI